MNERMQEFENMMVTVFKANNLAVPELVRTRTTPRAAEASPEAQPLPVVEPAENKEGAVLTLTPVQAETTQAENQPCDQSMVPRHPSGSEVDVGATWPALEKPTQFT